MGNSCCASEVDWDFNKEVMEKHREKHGDDVLVVAIKDQNRTGKLCIAGGIDTDLEDAILNFLHRDKKNRRAFINRDKYDKYYDTIFHGTVFTTGHSFTSLQKNYFPRGRLCVEFLDLIGQHGWMLAAGPNFGGVEARDDNGNVTSTVDWPVMVFYRAEEKIVPPKHLMLAVKDTNIPGKLCCVGPITNELKDDLLEKMRVTPNNQKVRSELDKYDKDFDMVIRGTSITTGAKVISLEKAYFPRGKTIVSILQTVYTHGWRLIAAPNFGGSGDSWPTFIFKQVKDKAPEVLFAAMKDQNIPGKLCLAGKDAKSVGDAVVDGMRRIQRNGNLSIQSDDYDGDFDAVVHHTEITTGNTTFSLKLPYFPRGDAMVKMLQIFNEQGYNVVACPNFGGMTDSWPSFVLEKNGKKQPPLFVAIKDDNIPGKLDMGGGKITEKSEFSMDLLYALQQLNGDMVTLCKDDYDRTFDVCFKNTKITSGMAAFSFAKPYFPHGVVVESVLSILLTHGYKIVGGPNFGKDGLSWPCFICIEE